MTTTIQPPSVGLAWAHPNNEVWYVYKTEHNVLRVVGTSWGVCMAGC